MAKLILVNEANTSITTPPAGTTTLFPDTDNRYKIKNSAGTVQTLLNMSAQSIATAAGTTTMVNTDPITTKFTGSTTQTVKLPDATTLQAGQNYLIINNSSGLVTLQDGNAGALVVLNANTTAYASLIAAGSVAGTWDVDESGGLFTDTTDPTKKLLFTESGATTGTTLTIAEAQSTSQTLNIPNIAATSILITDTLAQTITGVKTMTNMTAAATTTTVPSYTITTAGTLMTSPTAGVFEADAAAFYNTIETTEGRRVNDSWRFFKLAANGTPFTAITDYFGTNSAAGFVTNAVLEIEWHCYFAIAALSTQVVTWTITNTQTTTNMVANWAAQNAIANGATQGVLTGATLVTQTGAAVALPATGVMVIGNHYHIVRALIECATAGNVRLRCATASTATVGPLRGSWYRVRRLPALNAGTFVA